MTKKVIVAYIPVLHQGYRIFLENNPDFHDLYILSDPILGTFRNIVKDIRRLKPEIVRQSLTTWNLLHDITVADVSVLETLNSSEFTVLMPDEEISQLVAEQFFPDAQIRYASVFLRWDRRSSNAKDPIKADLELDADQFHKTFFDIVERESFKSSDIWRRVGAAIAKNGKLVNKSHNQSMPTQHSSWLYGDPRNDFTKGDDIDKTVFMHAEAKLIAGAARNGVSLIGTDMFVTTFPCPSCAMLVAESGIKRLFFQDGYATLGGNDILKVNNVSMIKVNYRSAQTIVDDKTTVAYPEK